MLTKESSEFGEIDTNDMLRCPELRKLKTKGTDIKNGRLKTRHS